MINNNNLKARKHSDWLILGIGPLNCLSRVKNGPMETET